MSSDIATGFVIKFLYSCTNTTFQILVAVPNYTNSELRNNTKRNKSDDAELATTIPHRKMAVDLSSHMISSSALAEAMTNEASRQFNSWLIRLDCLVISVGRVIPHKD
jgi:hypothetical protein